MYEMKYDIDDRPWMLGWRAETYERIPVQVRVDQRFLEQQHKQGRWIESYGVQQLDGEGLCIGFGTDPFELDAHGDPATFPLYYVVVHDWDLYPSREALLDYMKKLTEDIF